MSYVRLTPEQQRGVCEDLLAIEEAEVLPRLAAVRQQLLRERRAADHWQQVAIDRLTKLASSLIGGTRGYWREAAAAALGVPSVADVTVEAVYRVADDVRMQEQPPVACERATARARFTLSRNRGGR